MAEISSEFTTNAAPAQTPAEDPNCDLAVRYRNQAIILSQNGRFADSEACSREALRLQPDDVTVLNELGVAVWRQGRPAEAEAIYRRACQIEPDDFRVLNNLGLALYSLGKIDEAGDCYRRALNSQPNVSDTRMNLGIVLSDQGKFDEATVWLRAAQELRPDSADILQNIGMNLARQGRWFEAIDYYRQALRRKPDSPELHRNLASALLACGDYECGWPEYEWRLRCHPLPGYTINRPFWNGDNLPDGTILLHAEQGFGDTLQFIRFASMVKQRVGRVVVLCPAPLLELVARCRGVDLAFDGGSYHPSCHVQAPLLSLPAILGTTLETLPADIPYLVINKVLVDRWRAVLAKTIGADGGNRADGNEGPGIGKRSKPFLIGIAWQGSRAHRMDRWRSFPLASFAPLAKLPDVRLVSLQVGDGLDQLNAADLPFPVIDLPNRSGRDFMETASILAHLDLVITPDTALAHLAGALGLPVWVGLSTIGDWRWPPGRDASPWYRTARLFRQTTLGCWADVFQRMADALQQQRVALSARTGTPG